MHFARTSSCSTTGRTGGTTAFFRGESTATWLWPRPSLTPSPAIPRRRLKAKTGWRRRRLHSRRMSQRRERRRWPVRCSEGVRAVSANLRRQEIRDDPALHAVVGDGGVAVFVAVVGQGNGGSGGNEDDHLGIVA